MSTASLHKSSGVLNVKVVPSILVSSPNTTLSILKCFLVKLLINVVFSSFLASSTAGTAASATATGATAAGAAAPPIAPKGISKFISLPSPM